MITTQKIYTGIFGVLNNGIETEYRITNLDRGFSGNGKNTYGITNRITGKVTSIGTLAKAKKTVTHWILAEAKKQEKEIDLSDWEPVSEEEQNAMLKRETGIALRK